MPHTTTNESALPRADLAALDDGEPTLSNVEQVFARLRCRGEYLRVWDGGDFEGFRYTNTKSNDLGLDNHFQGMMRLRRGPYAVVSGGDPHETMSHLFIIELGTKQHVAGGPWRSNTPLGDPLARDSVILTVELDPVLWHGGGVSCLGDILAAPIETSDNEYSRIVFLDMADPAHPARIDPALDIKRPGEKAGAVALTKLPDGRYLCGVWSDSDKLAKKLGCARLDCYLSKSTDWADGFYTTTPTRWLGSTARAAGAQDREVPKFQAVNFVRQSDGALYLAGMHNTSDVAPVLDGDDEVHLFAFEIPESGGSATNIAEPIVTKVAAHRFRCNHSQCNMDAASGVYVSGESELYLYASFHFRKGGGPTKQLRFNEFRPHTEPLPAAELDMRHAWFELFDEPYFEGKFLAMQGLQDTSITNYGRLYVQSSDAGFHDKVSSARYQLPRGMRYVLYRHSDFDERLVELSGTGQLAEIPDLATVRPIAGTGHSDNQVSSSHFEFQNPADGTWSLDQP